MDGLDTQGHRRISYIYIHHKNLSPGRAVARTLAVLAVVDSYNKTYTKSFFLAKLVITFFNLHVFCINSAFYLENTRLLSKNIIYFCKVL